MQILRSKSPSIFVGISICQGNQLVVGKISLNSSSMAIRRQPLWLEVLPAEKQIIMHCVGLPKGSSPLGDIIAFN